MKKRIIINYKNKKIKVLAEDCNILQKSVGLMFSRRQKAKILLFNFKEKQKIMIHSIFVFYDFVAVWLDKKNKVVDMKIVRPFSPYVSHRKKAFSLVEIPINNHYRRIVKILVGN
jgi:uncharacterized membrane protein (UPF0127 family)